MALAGRTTALLIGAGILAAYAAFWRSSDSKQSAYGFTVRLRGPAALPNTREATSAALASLGVPESSVSSAALFQDDTGANALQLVTRTGLPKPTLPKKGTMVTVLGVPLVIDAITEAT